MIKRLHLIVFSFLCALSTMAGVCPADVNGDGRVDRSDLRDAIDFWSGICSSCTSDVDGDGGVTILDFVLVQQQHGSRCGNLITTQLAGGQLDVFPFFEHVSAFNEGSPIQVGLETWQFPWVMGLTVDIYIVEAKDFDQWLADPNLIDATPDGFQTETFATGSISDNIFTLSGSELLSAEPGLGLGHAYDVVIDLNQNGLLDGTDFIDGLADEAAFSSKAHGCYVVQPGLLL